jgi:acetyl-CoA carboxylase carboxyltransferase component
MGADAAVEILYRKELSGASDAARAKKQKADEYRERFANPYVAAERGYVDAVIEPADTRRRLIAGLRLLETKTESIPPKKHGNIPL